MPTYVYETIPSSGRKARRFEVKQSMNDAALTIHPETGEPVRRVITGGLGFYSPSAESSTPPPTGPCGNACGCFGKN